jgi:hypothetical protein
MPDSEKDIFIHNLCSAHLGLLRIPDLLGGD